MNYAQIQDFAHRANHEMAMKVKAMITLFYGREPSFSYFSACSGGGREAVTEAVRYPNDFDGILAGSPAINWTRFVPAELWPQVAMKEEGNYLPICKQTAIANIVQQACDTISDGLNDGVMDPRFCDFEPAQLLGLETGCGAITGIDVTVVSKIWEGPRDAEGRFLWYGLYPGTATDTLASTNSTPAGSGVDGAPFTVPLEWFRWWIYKDPSWDWHEMTYDAFARGFEQSVTEWAHDLASDDPDLSAFRAHGGKFIIVHGLMDKVIFPQGTIDYYERVLDRMGGVGVTSKFARLFLPPNNGHCGADSSGPIPDDPFTALVKWREEGITPDSLHASGTSASGEAMTRPVCPYPQVARFSGSGSILEAQNFVCRQPKGRAN